MSTIWLRSGRSATSRTSARARWPNWSPHAAIIDPSPAAHPDDHRLRRWRLAIFARPSARAHHPRGQRRAGRARASAFSGAGTRGAILRDARMARDPSGRELATAYAADLVHLNAPAQAAEVDLPCPILVVSHSCVVTWLHAVRGQVPTDAWAWQKDRNRAGFNRADIVVAPSRSHADMLEACYGPVARLSVVHNSALPG
ncbi:MAG: hypothetical protein E5X09_14290, partial [Mesorhizobium sp.]